MPAGDNKYKTRITLNNMWNVMFNLYKCISCQWEISKLKSTKSTSVILYLLHCGLTWYPPNINNEPDTNRFINYLPFFIVRLSVQMLIIKFLTPNISWYNIYYLVSFHTLLHASSDVFRPLTRSCLTMSLVPPISSGRHLKKHAAVC